MTPWTAARQASLSFTISQSLLKLMSIESVMPSSHLILCCPLLFLPSIFPSIRVFSKELDIHISIHQLSSKYLLSASLTLQSPGLFFSFFWFCLLFHFLLLTYPIPDLQCWPAPCFAWGIEPTCLCSGPISNHGLCGPHGPPHWCSCGARAAVCEGGCCVLEDCFRLQLACHPLIHTLSLDDIL